MSGVAEHDSNPSTLEALCGYNVTSLITVVCGYKVASLKNHGMQRDSPCLPGLKIPTAHILPSFQFPHTHCNKGWTEPRFLELSPDWPLPPK